MVKVDVARWGPHVRAAKAAGVSLARYAREHGLSRHTLYAAVRAERDRRAIAEAGAPGPAKALGHRRRAARAVVSPFVPVAVGRSSARLAVRLPNGVALECQDFDADVLRALIASLAALPCSA